MCFLAAYVAKFTNILKPFVNICYHIIFYTNVGSKILYGCPVLSLCLFLKISIK